MRIIERESLISGSGLDDANLASWAGGVGKASIGSDQFAIQSFSKPDVGGIVGSHIGAQLVGPCHERQCGMSHDGKVTEIGDGAPESSGSQVTVEPPSAQHRNSLDVNKVGSSQVTFGSQHSSRRGTVSSIITEGVGDD